MKTYANVKYLPLDEVISIYIQNQKRKSCAARAELKGRCRGMGMEQLEDKYRIIALLMQSEYEADRLWSYLELFSIWDDRFLPLVQDVWEKYHDARCTGLIVHYFPIAYIETHESELMINRNYYHYCMRRIDDPTFVVDDSKLTNPVDCLDLLVLRKAPTEQIEAQLMIIINNLCTTPCSEIMLFEIKRGECISLLGISDIRHAYYILNRNNQDRLCDLIEWWNNDIRTAIETAGVLGDIEARTISEDAYVAEALQVAMHYIRVYFAGAYPKEIPPVALHQPQALPNAPEILNDLYAACPAAQSLVEELQLVVISTGEKTEE